jgi:hypothetical protein
MEVILLSDLLISYEYGAHRSTLEVSHPFSYFLCLMIFIPEEGGLPPVAQLSAMVWDAGGYDASKTGHVRKLSHSHSRVNGELSKVFKLPGGEKVPT